MVVDSRTTFKLDLPGLREWNFDEEKVVRLTQPVFNILGGQSEALWARFVYRLIQGWLPQAEGIVFPDSAHFLTLQNPGGMAKTLAEFFQLHPFTKIDRGNQG